MRKLQTPCQTSVSPQDRAGSARKSRLGFRHRSAAHRCSFWGFGTRSALWDRMRRTAGMMIAALGLAASQAAATDELPVPGRRTATVVPGAHYEAGWSKRLILGDHWRAAWDTPIEVPVLDLDA